MRFCYVIVMRIFSIIHFVPKMARYAKHTEKYSEKDKYALAQTVINKVRKTARATTEYMGLENLPSESGYIMYANHQDKYDALGILAGHDRPCSVLMDKKRSEMFICKQFVDLLGGQRIEKNNPRQQIRVLNAIADEVNKGRNYLIFPEGGYEKKTDNSLSEFKYGCFTSAVKAKCPIVPVAIIDSFKVFGGKGLGKVHTKVIFLPAIEYEEYAGMRAKELCALVRERILEEVVKHDERAAEAVSNEK